MLESFFEAYNKMIKSPQTRINTEFFHTKKSTAPATLRSAKAILSVRDQGLEPWTPCGFAAKKGGFGTSPCPVYSKCIQTINNHVLSDKQATSY